MYQRGSFALLQRKRLEQTPDKLMSEETGYDGQDDEFITKQNHKVNLEFLGSNWIKNE